MDSDKALETIRELMKPLHPYCGGKAGGYDLCSGDDYSCHCDDLYIAWEALDEWLCAGKALPEAWQHRHRVPTEEEAFAAGVRGERPAHFAARVADALTREYAELQKRILRSLDRTSGSGVAILMDPENHGACTQLEELGLVAKGDTAITDSGDWTIYFITEAGKALVERWRRA